MCAAINAINVDARFVSHWRIKQASETHQRGAVVIVVPTDIRALVVARAPARIVLIDVDGLFSEHVSGGRAVGDVGNLHFTAAVGDAVEPITLVQPTPVIVWSGAIVHG